MSKARVKVGDKLWVLYIDYGHNEFVKAFATRALADKWLYDYVVENWKPEDFDHCDPCEHPNDAIEMYFDANDDESWWIRECEIIRG